MVFSIELSKSIKSCRIIRRRGDDMKSIIIGGETDLGVHIDGAKLGPVQLINLSLIHI